jgi:ATP-dependent DNA helicase RecG
MGTIMRASPEMPLFRRKLIAIFVFQRFTMPAMISSTSILDSPIEYLKGVGPARAELLKKELGIHTFGDLLEHYPYRYIDKTQFHRIRDLSEDSGEVQIKGVLRRLDIVGEGRKRRLVGRFRDESGAAIDLVWFSGVSYLEKNLTVGAPYSVYGRVNAFRDQLSIPHPEMEKLDERNAQEAATFAPVYASTEKLNNKGIDARARRRLIKTLLERLSDADLPENLPEYLRRQYRLPPRAEALRWIHLPPGQTQLDAARARLKFEELFFLQLRLLRLMRRRKESVKGFVFEKVGEQFNRFFHEKLPFELTGAQKRVIREIRRDLGDGVQMNRLLQGDVGSGKTIVALMCVLLAVDNGFQACLMAPTEILAQQHFQSIAQLLEGMDIQVDLLTGSVKGKKRRLVLERLKSGELRLLIGTHALIEPTVEFQRLGLAIIDEQHRFGVAQRAKLWAKSAPHPPHVLVMTATPIPRTLAMTLYGDLDVSLIDELPPGRKEILTLHRTENHRLRVFGFLREQIALGRQVYVVYPLIEESEALDLQNLQEGYEALHRAFPPPEYQLSIVHGRMKPADKEFEMRRFAEGKTQIMVATTVIEVGVNVPNASVMLIENTERFGLSQLHQLRGRVGRGAEQSYCILMSSFKLSAESRERIHTMTSTTNGFEIAEADLRLRGPGNFEGTQQSGLLNFRIADLIKDKNLLLATRDSAQRILDEDSQLQRPEHQPLNLYLQAHNREAKAWSRIS